MRKRILALCMALCMMLALAPAALAVDDDNEGIDSLSESTDWSTAPDTSWFDANDKQETYTLTTAAQLAGLFSLMKVSRGETFANITIKLGNDIVLNDTTDDDWSDSAAKLDSSGRKTFAGTFDGGGYSIIGLYSETGLFPKFNGTIKNLTIDTAVISCTKSGIYVGAIVGDTSTSAKIENCTVKDSTIAANYNTLGGVVGSAGNTPVKNCTVTNCTISSGGGVGGVCGTGGVIESCSVSADCSISGGSWVGGIVGSMGKSVTNCTNAAPVSGTGSSIGGIVGGHSGSGSVISGCTNTGTVTGTSSVGGIIGGTTAQTLEISDCTNSGNVTGTTAVGGIAGHLFVDIAIKGCTSEGSVSGTNDVGGIVGQSDLSTGQPYVAGTPNSITDCIVSAEIKGETNVGGLVGSNDVVDDSGKEATTIANNILTPDASVSGSTNVGALIGDNQTETDTGTIKNNFWPEAAGSASGNGAGSSSDTDTESTIQTANSSYGADGTLNTPVTAGEGDEATTVETIGDVFDKILDDTKAPDALKATVKFDKNGHGSTQSTQTVVIGTKITLPPMNNDGYYTFLYWTANDQTYDAGAEYTVTENVTFTANWRNDKPSSSSSSSASYTVSAEKAEDGKITVSPAKAEKGDTVTITVKPDSGYVLDELVITDKNGKEISYKEKSETKFTFTMPGSKVTVEATFAPEEDRTIVLTLGSTLATVYGTPVINDVAPVARNNRTMLPIRFVAEALGARVDWDQAQQKVTITRDTLVIEIYLGSDVAYVNGQPVQLDSPAFAENNRTYLPLRFVAENLGAVVEWDAAAQTVTITAA